MLKTVWNTESYRSNYNQKQRGLKISHRGRAWIFGPITVFAFVFAGHASAQTCSATSLPYTLTNGVTADASQVMADLNCVATYGLAQTTSNVGIGTPYPGANLQVTGNRTNQPAMIIIGNSSVYWPQVSLWFDDVASGGHNYSIGNAASTGTFSIADQSVGLSRLNILPNGYIGIGTSTPQNQLQVAGGITTTAGGVAQTAAGPALNLYYDTTYDLGRIDTLQNAVAWKPLVIRFSTFSLLSGGYAQGLYQNASGYVGIGTTSPGTTLDVAGSVRISNNSSYYFSSTYGASAQLTAQGDNNFVFSNTDSSGNIYPSFAQDMHSTGAAFTFLSPVQFDNSYYSVSDARLKKNIQPISGGLSIIQNLRPVSYDWRTVAERPVGKKLSLPLDEHQMGFIAQELQTVLPDAVKAPSTPDGVYTIKEQNIIPVLVEAVKELQAEVDQLKAAAAVSK